MTNDLRFNYWAEVHFRFNVQASYAGSFTTKEVVGELRKHVVQQRVTIRADVSTSLLYGLVLFGVVSCSPSVCCICFAVTGSILLRPMLLSVHR